MRRQTRRLAEMHHQVDVLEGSLNSIRTALRDVTAERNTYRDEIQRLLSMVNTITEAEMSLATKEASMVNLSAWIMDLEDLIRWLAFTYDQNDPIFPSDPERPHLWSTWQRVVRRINPDDQGRSWAGAGRPRITDAIVGESIKEWGNESHSQDDDLPLYEGPA